MSGTLSLLHAQRSRGRISEARSKTFSYRLRVLALKLTSINQSLPISSFNFMLVVGHQSTHNYTASFKYFRFLGHRENTREKLFVGVFAYGRVIRSDEKQSLSWISIGHQADRDSDKCWEIINPRKIRNHINLSRGQSWAAFLFAWLARGMETIINREATV